MTDTTVTYEQAVALRQVDKTSAAFINQNIFKGLNLDDFTAALEEFRKSMPEDMVKDAHEYYYGDDGLGKDLEDLYSDFHLPAMCVLIDAVALSTKTSISDFVGYFYTLSNDLSDAISWVADAFPEMYDNDHGVWLDNA